MANKAEDAGDGDADADEMMLKMLTKLATAMLMKRMIVQANCYCWRGNSLELNDHRKSQLKIEMMMMIESLGHIF